MSVQRRHELTFSDDSLGESTRSLLSPFLGNSAELDDELSEGTLSLSSDDENEAGLCNNRHENTFRGLDQGKIDSGGRNESYRSISRSEISRSGSTVPVTKSGTKSYKSASSKRTTTKGTRRSPSYSESFITNSSYGFRKSKDSGLSPWEEWLVKKTVEDRERHKREVIRKQKEKEIMAENKRRKEENFRVAEQKCKEWCEEKNRIEKEKRRVISQQKQIDLEKKEQTKREIEEKSKQKYGEWLNKKRAENADKRKLNEKNKREEKEKEIERKMRSEEEYEKWQKQLKTRPKSVYNSFGYCGGKLTGYYEWGSYPAPSYVNPIPWVHTGVKRNKDRRCRKKEMQPPSPPLLFRDIEQRRKHRK